MRQTRQTRRRCLLSLDQVVGSVTGRSASAAGRRVRVPAGREEFSHRVIEGADVSARTVHGGGPLPTHAGVIRLLLRTDGLPPAHDAFLRGSRGYRLSSSVPAGARPSE